MENFLYRQLKKIMEKGDEEVSKVFFCDPQIFIGIFKIEKRRTRNFYQKLQLIHYKLAVHNEMEITDKEKILFEILDNNLRKSDVITKWGEGYFIQLLVTTKQTAVKTIICRIEGKIKNSDIKEDIFCSYEEI